MLDSRIDRSPISRRTGLMIAAALVLATIPLAGLAVQATPAPRAVAAGARSPAATSAAPEGAAPSQAAPAAATSLSGTVFDPSGKTMPEVVVDVARVAASDGPKPQLRTGADGRFQITGLAPGEYEVTSSRPGFKKNVRRVSLTSGTPATLRVDMQIGSLSETITVTAGAAPSQAPVAAAGRAPVDPPRPDPCDNSTAGGCLTPPRKLVDVRPAYPPALAAKKATADVVIKATLQKDGMLGDFRPDAGPEPAFVEAALAAIRQWTFTPAKLNGVPQECQVTVTIRFVSPSAS